MKHKRKSHKKSHTKKRKRSSMGAIDITNILGVVAGAVGAGYLDKVIPSSIDKKISSIGKIAIGVILPNLSKSGKMKNILAGVGSGMVAVGSIDMLKGFGVLSGMDDEELLEVTLNGDQDVLAGEEGPLSVVNGGESVLADDLSVINGDDEEFENSTY